MAGRVGTLTAIVLAVGCHGPAVVVPPPRPAAAPPPELPVVTPTRIQPPASSLPKLDPLTTNLSPVAADTFRGLTEDQCRCLAAAASSVAHLLEQEGDGPKLVPKKKACPPDDAWLAEARALAAAEARNRAAGDALDRYFELADAEGRADLLSAALKAFDALRTEAPGLRALGLPVPTDDELYRQRAKLVSDAESAEAGIRLLNIDLKMKLGLPVRGDERLWPVGPFPVSGDAIDAEPLVAEALESRPDLRLLRTVYANLSAATLPAARDQLSRVNPLLGADTRRLTPLGSPLMRRFMPDPAAALAAAEVPVRKRQLFELIAEREKQAAIEVRAAVAQMASAAKRVGLANARAESWRAKAEKEAKPADRLPAEIEWLRARSEVVSEALTWHRWRGRLLAARGRAADGCGP